MAVPVPLPSNFDGEDLRALAKGARDVFQCAILVLPQLRQLGAIVGAEPIMGAAPARAVQDQQGMGSGIHVAAHLAQVQANRFAVAAGQDETDALALHGTKHRKLDV